MAKKKTTAQNASAANMQNMFTQQMMNMMNPLAAPIGFPSMAPAAAQLFYANIGGRQAGPFPVAEISRLAAMGSITRNTLVWRQGMSAWQIAAAVPEIAALFPAAAPPAPPPPPPAPTAPAFNAAALNATAFNAAAAHDAPMSVSAPSVAAKAIVCAKSWEDYSLPVEGILNQHSADADDDEASDAEANANAAILEQTLAEFKIEAKVTGIRKGPAVTMFEVLPAPGIKLSKISSLEDNIALRLAASSMRIVSPIPGKHAVGIEVPNKKRSVVSFREIIETNIETEDALPVFLGKDISGEVLSADLASMPHLLVAGATGSGKSVCVNTMILSLLYRLSPEKCRMIFIDPKIVELKIYNGIPHLLMPVITDPEAALTAMSYCVSEMERRYVCLDKMGSRNIKSYNKLAAEKGGEVLPYLVVIIDEFADLMAVSGKELEAAIVRLAAMSRAVGIHLVLATQRPSADVITGLIKSNIPTRIAFMVAAMTDSRIIIDSPGAEKLLGKGDMLYCSPAQPFPIRAQGAFVCEEEAERTAAYLRTLGEPEYINI